MMSKTVFLVLIGCWFFTTMAQEMSLHRDGLEMSYLIGEWDIQSSHNLGLFQNGEANEQWEETQVLANIQPYLDGFGLLEKQVGVINEGLYQATIFRGINMPKQTWAVAWTNSHMPSLQNMLAETDGQGSLIAKNSRWESRIEVMSNDSFVWQLFSASDTADPSEAVWLMRYTRAEAGSYQKALERYQATYDAPAYPSEMDDFNFWLGNWDVDSVLSGKQGPATDSLERVSGGHAMIETWVGRDEAHPFSFFSMTVWDDEIEGYYNWYWNNSQRVAREFKGGSCSGEGAEKSCMLAGRFFNITETSIDWAFRNIWTMTFTRSGN